MQYTPPKLVMFSGMVNSGCGTAESAMGPFYCPADQKVYIDTQFFKDMRTQMGISGEKVGQVHTSFRDDSVSLCHITFLQRHTRFSLI